MTPERWRRVEELYDAAANKATHDRAVFLAEACPDDFELREQVEKLVRRAKVRSPLDAPPWKLLESSDAPPGTEMGPYRIVELIGSGGMGRVYKAIDTRLGRTVAIKVSKSRFGARFRGEARAISALNHPNICTLYDVGPNFQVMEYLEGSPLKGPMKLDKVLPIAIAVAGALSAAHRAAVAHGDLKPGNILLTKSGPKLLDFGLARVDGDSGDAGGFAGTFGYMAPERRQGGPVDARSDIFAFGVTLFELIKGHLPDDDTSPANCPSALQHLIERCIALDPEARWQSIRDVQSELEWIVSQPRPAAQRAPRLWKRLAVSALLIATGAVAAWMLVRRQPPPVPIVRFTISAPAGTRFAQSSIPVLSPDGRRLIFVTTTDLFVGQRRWLHDFTTGENTPMDGAPTGNWGPWSPSSDSFLIYGSERLLRFDLSGASTEVLHEPLSSFAWAPNGSLLLGIPGKGLFLAPKSGERRLIVPNRQGFAQTTVVQALAGGRILFWAFQPTVVETWVANSDGQTKLLMPRPALYAPPGYLLYQMGDSIMAQPYDSERTQLAGGARTLVSGVAHNLLTSVGNFAVSENGTLVFLHDRPLENNRIQIFNRRGEVVDQATEPGDYLNPALSPDGRKLAVAVRSALTREVWVIDLNRHTRERISADSPDNNNATWSPDGSQIAFSAERHGIHEIHVRSSSGNGPERLLLKSDFDINPLDWSRDGRYLVYNSGNAQHRRELWALPLNPEPGAPFRLMESKDSRNWASISPNGRWLLYRAFEAGRNGIFLRRFTQGDQTWEVSTGNDREAEWRNDGREIYFDHRGSLMAVDFREATTGPLLGSPHVMFPLPVVRFDGRDWFTLSRDGSRFFFVTTQAGAEEPLEVVVNWPRLLDGK